MRAAEEVAAGSDLLDGAHRLPVLAEIDACGQDLHHAKIDYARFYPHQMEEDFIEGRCAEAAQKIYNPAVHPREPYATGRGVKRSPFYEREKELGGYFMELGGWERAHGYAANEHLLKKYGNRVPVRENEWDNRHFWRVSNAEHLAMSEDCGIVNLSHFYMFDVEGPDHVALMEWLCAAKIGGDGMLAMLIVPIVALVLISPDARRSSKPSRDRKRPAACGRDPDGRH